jgi:hypothetical protein
VNPVRRLAAPLREMRWGQVIVELALLIAGILAALAVDGWIDDRRDARLERQYLELLTRELDRDLQVLDEVLTFEEAQAGASAMVYRALRSGVVPAEREAVAEALGQLTSRRTLRLGRATYTDLLSTGNLRLIRNAELRDRIVRMYEANERTQMIRDRNNQEFVDRMYMTYLLDEGLVAPRPSRDLPAVSSYDSKFAARTHIPVDTGLDRLWRLPPDAPQWNVLMSRVWYRGLVSEGALEQSRQIVVEIGAVKSAIATELSTRRWP